jgi:hypothetical protein
MEQRKLVKPLQPRHELLSATERDAIVARHLREHLSPLGLAEIRPRTWIDGSRRPARRMFDLIILKGAKMRARWGFSLDFVPHISGGRLRWHRSGTTAMFDVIIEPSESVLPWPTFIHGAAHLHDDLNRLLPAAATRAEETWRQGQTIRGLLDLVREIRERKTNCFPFDNYLQLPLTCAFLLAKLGDLACAEQELDQYGARFRLRDDTLKNLKNLAREYFRNVDAAE